MRQESGDILPDQPVGPNSLSQRQELKREVAARISQSEPKPRLREGLAGGSPDEKLNRSDIFGSYGSEVPEIRDAVAPVIVAKVLDRRMAQLAVY
jgi:hypothetical protein